MRILIIGKFPPVQGGVSTLIYETTIKLSRNNSVTIVTSNKEENVAHFYGNDIPILESIDNLEVIVTSTDGENVIDDLFQAAYEACKNSKPDVVIGWYLEPYARAAVLLGKCLHIPVKVIHAGSDLFLLTNDPNRRKYIIQTLEMCDEIICFDSDGIFEQFLRLGKFKDKIVRVTTSDSVSRFSDGTKNLDFSLDELVESIDGDDRFLINSGRRSINLNKGVTLGLYGKLDSSKSAHELAKSLKTIGRSVEFNFLVLTNTTNCNTNSYTRNFIDIIDSDEILSSKTLILPFIAPWRVPGFLKACDIVFCLESGFPVKEHSPVIVREVLASGALLVCSEELRAKQFFRFSLISGKNCISIENPKDSNELNSKLINLLKSPKEIEEISFNGRKLSEISERTAKIKKGNDIVHCLTKSPIAYSKRVN